jgi:hypothetical protein
MPVPSDDAVQPLDRPSNAYPDNQEPATRQRNSSNFACFLIAMLFREWEIGIETA